MYVFRLCEVLCNKAVELNVNGTSVPCHVQSQTLNNLYNAYTTLKMAYYFMV